MQKSNFKQNIKRTWKYMKSSKANLFGYGIVVIIEAIISAITPFLAAKIILSITNGIMNQLMLSTLYLFLLEIVLDFMSALKGLFYQKIYHKTLVDLQISIAKEILNLEIEEIDKNSSGLFINRLNKDTQDISGLFMEYTYQISYIITNVGVLIAIFILNKYLFVYSIFTSIIIFMINKKRIHNQYEVQRNLKTLEEDKTGLTSELVRGIRDIKVLNASKTILNQISNKIEETTKEQVKFMNIRRIYQHIESNIRSFTVFLFVVLGCILYEKSLLTIPTFVILYNYQSKVRNLLSGIIQITEYNKKFNVAANRVYEVIENEKFKKETFGEKTIQKLTGNIEFKDVCFGYNKNNLILKNMNFQIYPNERVAFVGKSGAGKTTIFSLITRLYHINSGNILLDHCSIEELTRSTIRDNMSIITQNPYIFNFSIKDNLLLAKENATMEEIKEACKLACIDEYIMSLPNGYDTMVGENGAILSGGQKQRLAIARALLMKTEIILFDEATSALDNETQSQIQNAIHNLQGEYTVLIVAHRLSTVIDSDRIFVVDDGKIIDYGTHHELLQKCEYYQNLYNKDLQ